MTPTGNPNEFRANIPGQPAAIVHYWFSASDNYGASSTDPLVAPVRAVYTFLAGPASTVFAQTMESDPGWTVGATGDNAITGVWQRVNPNGTLVNGEQCAPEDDHSPGSGTVCWVTGNGAPAEDAGLNDVDGGRTTLTTNVFDATAGHYPVVEYYRWFTNNLGGEPGIDPWRTYLSNNGGTTWVAVENTTQSANSWQRILFFIDDYMTPTANIRMRFVAQDSLNGSLVEAGIDDFRLLNYPVTLAVDDGDGVSGSLALAAPMPNPALYRTTLRFTLPATGRAALRVYDLSGRAVRTLADGTLEAGPHAIEWNGRDDGGRVVAAGPYFVRLAGTGGEVSRKVMIVR
jgi:flagellar hook capping protein FlgD